jgi:hypothetical protein
MNSVPRSGRFDLRWLFPAIGKDGAALYEVPHAAVPFEAEEATNDPVGRVIDEALEKIGMEGCRVCPLCGAIVARDGSVLG